MNGTGSSHRAKARRTTTPAARNKPTRTPDLAPVRRVFAILTSHLINAIAPFPCLEPRLVQSGAGQSDEILYDSGRPSKTRTVFAVNRRPNPASAGEGPPPKRRYAAIGPDPVIASEAKNYRGAAERIGARSSASRRASVVTTRITVSAAPEKMSPRSVRPKIATGIVTQPGG